MGGKRRGEPAPVQHPEGHLKSAAINATLAALFLVAWVLLVLVAIKTGRSWREDSGIALLWFASSTLAAIAALFAVFAFAGRALRAVGVLPAAEPKPDRIPGGKRAAR